MPKMSKNTAYICIVSIGFTVIFLLWLPTCITKIKSIVQETGSSTSHITKELSVQSNEIFGDTGKKIKEGFQKLEGEKENKDELQAKVADILKENILNRQLQENTSSSSSTTTIITP